jgi:hypothetical protein
MQAHHVGCCYRAGGHVGVHIVSHVGGRAAGGQVGVVAQVDALAFGGNGVGAKALAGQASVGVATCGVAWLSSGGTQK